jgi:hypothetical protein
VSDAWLRDEFLAMEIFKAVRTARPLTASWRDEYNAQRTHGSLGCQTSAGFAAACVEAPCSSTLISPGPGDPTRSLAPP